MFLIRVQMARPADLALCLGVRCCSCCADVRTVPLSMYMCREGSQQGHGLCPEIGSWALYPAPLCVYGAVGAVHGARPAPATGGVISRQCGSVCVNVVCCGVARVSSGLCCIALHGGVCGQVPGRGVDSQVVRCVS